MQKDPTGVAAAPAAADTAATADVASSDGSTAEATRAAEGQPGESTETPAPTPDSDAESAEDHGEASDPDGESEDDQPRNDEERKLSRRERQRLREQERIDKAIADALAAKEREREQAEESRKRQETARAAEQARQERLARFVGSPETLSALDTAIAVLQEKIDSEILTPDGADLDDLYKQRNDKRAEKARLQENQAFQGEIAADIWQQIEADYAYPATFPELADPKARAAYLHNQGGIRGAMDALATAIRAHKDTEWQAKLDAQAKDHQTKLKALEADRDGWRVRAGGGSVAPEEAGTPSVDGIWTRERLARLTPAEYRKHRESIARAEAAGLIR